MNEQLLLESLIQWCRWTWNPWWGCRHVSPGCANCYADRHIAGRYGGDFNAIRRTSKSVWRKPYHASKQLEAEFPGVPIAEIPVQKRLMFTASMSDIFIAEADDWREDFWQVVRENPKVVFQILTKRHGRIKNHLPPDWGEGWENVWLGVSVENQEMAERRIPVLSSIPAKKKFISFEPLIEPLWLAAEPLRFHLWDIRNSPHGKDWRFTNEAEISWAIIGGESGNEPGEGQAGKFNYRPCELAWIESLVEQLEEMGTAVFVKQTGTYLAKKIGLASREGGNASEFPPSIRVQNFPL